MISRIKILCIHLFECIFFSKNMLSITNNHVNKVSDKMEQNSCFEKFRNAILENLLNFNEKDEYCDLEVHCSDGIVLVHGLVFGTICPLVKRYL